MADTWANDLMTHFIIPMGISRSDNNNFTSAIMPPRVKKKLISILSKTMDLVFVRQAISRLIDFWVSYRDMRNLCARYFTPVCGSPAPLHSSTCLLF